MKKYSLYNLNGAFWANFDTIKEAVQFIRRWDEKNLHQYRRKKEIIKNY